MAFELFCFTVAFGLRVLFGSFYSGHVKALGIEWPVLAMTFAAFGMPIAAACLRLRGSASAWRRAGGGLALVVNGVWFALSRGAGRTSFGTDIFHVGIAVLALGLIAASIKPSASRTPR